jgi:hypothetical protein
VSVHRFKGTGTVVDSGSGRQSAGRGSFGGPMLDEDLIGRHFGRLLDAQLLTEGWRIDSATNRPDGARGWLSAAELVEAWLRGQAHGRGPPVAQPWGPRRVSG